MSQILLRTSYDNAQPYGDRTGQVFGTMFDTTDWVFDTASEAVTASFAGTYDDFQDSNHPQEFSFSGEFYAYCVGTTRRGFVHDGRGGFTLNEEADSLSCGYVPPAPLTCDLGGASVSQVATPTGATLTVAFTGTANGHVQYRLDAGAEQTQPVFYNVSPGQHVVGLRDDGLTGCQRTVQVVVAPPPPPAAPAGAPQGLDFVGQPLWYSTAPVAANADVQLELWAESAHGQEDFGLVLTLRKRADKLGVLRFRLDTLLWPLLSAFVPAPGGTTRRCRTSLVNYFVRSSVLAPGVPPVYATGPLRTAVRGALPAEWQDREYFAFRAGPAFAQPPFLSWQPAGPGAYAAGQPKPITRAQPEWLFFVCPAAAQLRVCCTSTNSLTGAGVADYEDLAPPARGWAGQLLAIPLAPPRPGFAYLAVRVETPAGVAVSPSAWYEFVPETARTRYVLFTNSLSGVDTLRCEGRLDGTLEVAAGQVERPARYGDGAATAESQLSDLTAGRKLKLASGWLTPAELAWAQELTLARELWQQVGAQLRPLEAGKRTLRLAGDEPGLRGLLLEFDYAFSPTAYAPDRDA